MNVHEIIEKHKIMNTEMQELEFTKNRMEKQLDFYTKCSAIQVKGNIRERSAGIPSNEHKEYILTPDEATLLKNNLMTEIDKVNSRIGELKKVIQKIELMEVKE